MPIPTETLRDLNGLNRWFAVSCLSLLASLMWFIWEDYDRPWRGVQDNYMVVQAALAHLDFLDTQTEDYQKRLAEARGNVDQAKEATAARAEERATLVAELRAENARNDRISIGFGNADAVLQVTRSEHEEARSAHGPDAPETKAVKARLQREEEEVAALRREKEEVQDAQAALNRRIKQLDALVADAEKALAKLEKAVADARRKEDQYSNVLVKTTINLPMLDFTAPKGTASRHEVRQLVLPEVRQELNYLQTYTTDRCTTCHVAIDDRGFTRESLAARMERALPAINEALVKSGGTALPPPSLPKLTGDEAPKLTAGTVTEFWKYLSSEQQKKYFDELLEHVNAYLTRNGRHEIHLDQPLLAHPNLDLFVHLDSPHPMAKIGCTVCHEGNPQETDFVQAAHTPVDHHQEEEWKRKHYVTAAFIPNITFYTVEHHWDRPMLPPKYAEAGCAKCHSRVADIAEFRGESQGKRLNLGHDLFVRTGCVNCHNVQELGDHERVGPDLRHVGSKLRREFLEQWVFNPKSFRPSTWMPHLFLQENNGPGSENPTDPDPVLRTETEVSAIAHYLETLSAPWEPLPIPPELTPDAARGGKLFKEVGCLACHGNLKEFGREMIASDLRTREGRSEQVAEALYEEMDYVQRADYAVRHLASDRDTVFSPESIGDRPVFTRHAPELASIGSKVTKEWLFSWLKEPSRYHAETRMPSLRLTDQEAADLTAYLLTLTENKTFEPRRFPADEAHVKMADDLMFMILSGQNSAKRSQAIMEDEGGDLTKMLVTLLRTSPGAEQARETLRSLDLRAKRWMFLGSKMIAHYGCYACHKITGFESATVPGTDLSKWGEKPIGQLDFGFFTAAHEHIRESKPEVFGHVYPPTAKALIEWAHGQNPEESVTHTHAAFAKHKMLNPRIWDREKIKRPYDKLKMPNFYFTEEQADALVTYLLARKRPRVNEAVRVPYESTLTGAVADGRSLTRELNCVGCHKIEDNAATVHQYHKHNIGGRELFDEVNAPPWLRGEGSKVEYAWLYGFLNQVETLRPWLKVRMPSFRLTEQETTTLVKYFAGISQEESAALRAHLAAVDKFTAKVAASPDLTAMATAQRWFATDTLKSAGEYLARYGVKNRLILRYDVDPNNSAEELEQSYADLLTKVRFTQELFDVQFPFGDSPRPVVGDERFKLGEELFYELKCLACHVLGDPNLPGSNPQPSAPNLNLVHQRLRQEWTHRWLQEPALMQPGTKMPQWFPKSNSAFSSYPPDDRAAQESKYGAGGEAQMQLLMDFMVSAGVKNYTAVQPGGVPAAEGDKKAPAASDEEEEEEEAEEDESEEE